MATIKLDILTNTNADRDNSSVYADLSLDLQFNTTYNNQLTKQFQIADIRADYNLKAIYNSIASIVTTTPGQKPLNPVFGINFRDLLFLPVTEDRAQIIGNAIYSNVQRYEPRVNISGVNVTPIIDEGQYIVDMTVSIPRFGVDQVKIVGALDKTGFFFNN